MHKLYTLALICLLTGAVAACGNQAAAPAAAPTDAAATAVAVEPTTPFDLGGKALRIGTDPTYPPMEQEMSDKSIQGIDPDLANAICQTVNCTVTFVGTAWDGIFGALKTGEFDALMSAITIKPERETDSGGTFTAPYFTVGQMIMVRADNTAITGIESLAMGQIGVQTGTTGDSAATEIAKVPDANMRRFADMPSAVQALKNRDVDAVVVDNPTAETYMSTFAGELKLVGAPFTTEDYGILVSNKHPDVLAAFNFAIGQLKAAGEIDNIVKQWYTKKAAATAVP